MRQGRFLQTSEAETLLGEWLARDLGAAVGDWVTVRARSRFGAFQTLDLPDRGHPQLPDPVINQGTISCPWTWPTKPWSWKGR